MRDMDTTAYNDPSNLKLWLTIRLSRNAMSLAVGDPMKDGKMVYEPYEMNGTVSVAANLREAFDKSELLQSGYKNAVVLADSPVMLVPKDEYKAEQAPELYRYTISGHDRDDVLSSEMTETNAVAVFAINHDVANVLKEHFELLRIMPLQQPVWTHLYHRNFTGDRQKLFAWFHDRQLSVFRFERGRFRYANSFECTHAHDALYYILYVWKLLGMSNADDELYLAGNMPHAEWLKANLGKFLQRSFTINAAADFNLNEMAKRADIPYDVKALYLKGK